MELTLASSVVGVGVGEELIKLPNNENISFTHKINFGITLNGVTLVSAATIAIQGSSDGAASPAGTGTVAGDGAVLSPVLAVGSTAEKIAHGAFPFRVNAVNANKAVDAVGVVFSAAHKVALSKFGGIGVYINAAGAISTKINSAAQTDTLSFATAALALADVQLSTFPHPADTVRIGYILIAADAGLWTANTDDLTDGSDLTTATFYSETSSYTEIDEYTLDSDDIALQKGVFYLAADSPDIWMRLFLSSITGTGLFTVTDQLLPVARIWFETTRA